MINRTLDKAQTELEKGNLWRAKEILQGAIRSESYNVHLFEMIGTVYLRMGDLPEAGRFLFLSGARKSEYLEAIEIFLSRHRGKEPRSLLFLLPRKARLKTLSDYPDEVAQSLREMGLPEVLKDEDGEIYLPPRTGLDIVVWLICAAIAIGTLALIILGAVKLWEITR